MTNFMKTMFASCLVAFLALGMASCSSDDDDDLTVDTTDDSYTLTITYTDSSGNDLFDSGVSFSVDESDYPTTSVQITASKGLASLSVSITGGNSLVQTALSTYGLSTIELVGGNTTLSAVLSDLGASMSYPSSGDTSYSFPIYAFYGLLASFGTTDSAYKFAVTATDANGNTESETLSVTITEDDYTLTISYESEDGSIDYLSDGITIYTGDTAFPGEAIEIESTKGFSSILVEITGGNTMATYAFSSISSIELVGGNSTLDEVLSAMGGSMTYPSATDTSYSFPIYQFYGLLALLGATDAGSAHTFAITITDGSALGHSIAASLDVVVEEGSSIGISYTDDEGNDLFETGVTFDMNSADYPTNSIELTSAYGFESILVEVEAGNTTAAYAFSAISSIELVGGNTTLDSVLALFGATMTYPESGATSYSFPIANFYGLLALLGTTDDEAAHVFNVTVTDVLGNTATTSLSVVVEENVSITYASDDGTIDYLSSGLTISASSSNYPSSGISIVTPNGLKSLVVTITAGNDNFTEALALLTSMGITLDTGYEMVDDQLLGPSLSFSSPTSGATSYDFPIASFYSLLAILGTTNDGTPHEFTLAVEDNEGYTNSATLLVTVTE